MGSSIARLPFVAACLGMALLTGMDRGETPPLSVWLGTGLIIAGGLVAPRDHNNL
jgi:hypothetical protein